MFNSNEQQNHEALNAFAKYVLDLAQSSLPEHQFMAFRKMILDQHAQLKRALGKDRYQHEKDAQGKS